VGAVVVAVVSVVAGGVTGGTIVERSPYTNVWTVRLALICGNDFVLSPKLTASTTNSRP